MTRKVNGAANAASCESTALIVQFGLSVSRLGPDGLRSLAVETARLAGLATTEGRDSASLGKLSESLRNHANRLDPQQVTN